MSRRRHNSVEQAIDAVTQRFDSIALCRLIQWGDIGEADVEPVARMLLRSNLIFTRSQPDCQSRRNACLAEIAFAIEHRIGATPAAGFRACLSQIDRIEAGYAVLTRSLDAALGETDPVQWLWASLSLASEQVIWALAEIDVQVARNPMIDGTSYTLPDGDDGDRYRADELMAMIDATTSTILRMYAARWGWIEDTGTLAIPVLDPSPNFRHEGALAIQALAQAWDAWRRIDDNLRFFGGDLVEEPGTGSDRLLWRHVPSIEGLEWQRLNLAAHEKLTAEIMSIFNHLAYRENAHERAAGIGGRCPLYPEAFICISELQAAHALDIALSTTIEQDKSLYGGLRLVEWIRGYATLTTLAEVAARSDGGNERLLIIKTEEELLHLLSQLGLSRERARTFIRNVTFSRRSRDVVDEPLIRMRDGRYLLFGPTIVNGEIRRILLSKLSRDGVSFERRGKRFESEMIRRFQEWGLRAVAFKARRSGEEFDYDLLVPWDGHLFMFECKSRGATGVDPARAWQAQQAWRSALRQTQRLADALRKHPDILDEAIGVEARQMRLVPCVLNALPFQIAGAVDGVYFTDFAAIATFFQIGEVGAYATHRLPGLPPTRQRLFVRRLWAGSAPNAADFIRYLAEAPTLSIMTTHLEEDTRSVSIGEGIRIQTTELARMPDDVNRVIETLGGDSGIAVQRSRGLSEILQRLARLMEVPQRPR